MIGKYTWIKPLDVYLFFVVLGRFVHAFSKEDNADEMHAPDKRKG
jgi:hypothetical protein